MNISDILQAKRIFRGEAQEAIKTSIQDFLKRHPLLKEISWSHGDHYNDETYFFSFSGLSFQLEPELHKTMATSEWAAKYPFPIYANRSRWEDRHYKNAEEYPEAYADGKLASALEELIKLDNEFRNLDAELVDIFCTSDEKCTFVTVTPDSFETKERYF